MARSRELGSYFFGELCGSKVDLCDTISKAKLTENDTHSVERVGLNDVATYAEEACVNVANDVRPAEYEYLVAVLFAPIIIQSGVVLVDIGAHRPVVNDDALLNELEKSFHFRLASGS